MGKGGVPIDLKQIREIASHLKLLFGKLNNFI